MTVSNSFKVLLTWTCLRQQALKYELFFDIMTEQLLSLTIEDWVQFHLLLLQTTDVPKFVSPINHGTKNRLYRASNVWSKVL